METDSRLLPSAKPKTTKFPSHARLKRTFNRQQNFELPNYYCVQTRTF